MRLFVLLTWHPALGLPANPVGVLGVEETAGGRCKHHVSWLPSLEQTTSRWPSRLAISPTMATIAAWLNDESSTQLAELATPPGAASLADAVETTAGILLTGTVPDLPPPEP